MKNISTKSNVSFRTLSVVLILSIITSAEVIAQSTFSKANGVVTDSNTNLQWQDDYQDNNNEIKMGSYTEAQAYCEELALSEHNDWRLPTRDELLSIVDNTREDQPAIDIAFEMVTADDGYLTTTQYEDDEELVWTVDFTHGESLDVALIFTDGYFVRCVRRIGS